MAINKIRVAVACLSTIVDREAPARFSLGLLNLHLIYTLKVICMADPGW
jgi:hypothetical protein